MPPLPAKAIFRVRRVRGFPRTPPAHIGRLGYAWQAGPAKVFWCVRWDGNTQISPVLRDHIEIILED